MSDTILQQPVTVDNSGATSANPPAVVTKPEAPVNLKVFSPVDLEKARQIAKTIQFKDSNALVQYGVGAQANISSFATTVLQSVRVKDSGQVGESLTDLMFKIKDAGVGDLTSGKTGWFQSLADKAKRFMAKYEKLEDQIDKIVRELNNSRMVLLKDITMLDQLYAKNLEYLHDLDLFLAAGQIKLDELNANDVPQLQAKAQQTGDPVDAQNLNDLQQFIHRFEKKLYDMKLSRIIAIQTAPQIRMIQSNDQTLAEKVQSSIVTTIPLWKNQIIIAITLMNQKRAVMVQKAVDDATNDLLIKNSELLKQNSIEVATANERGIVEIETLKTTNANLLSTIDEVLRIQQEGKQKRVQAQAELAQIEADLKAKLTATQQAIPLSA